ncbi:P27 family phage terminase small subunit [Azospirillum tabaci]|uniref:P27 family phage terminase small subunit n=1 Tax=Azospirillum tabaci TaxID=2752310 RepID=UPI001660816B|nr:P27 family phage terminase small subunit [Azospirillum tabaci]
MPKPTTSHPAGRAAAPVLNVSAPPTVAGDSRAAELWGEAAKAMGARLTPFSAPLVASFCLAVARLEDAERKIAASGLLVKKGQAAEVNPLLAVVERQLRIVRDLADTVNPPASPWANRSAGR